MLPGIILPAAPVVYRPDLMSQLAQLGLLGSLQIALDAGEAASYNPAAQTAKWLDLSGNGQSLYRGTTAAGDTAEPTFNGTAGNRSKNEYWSFDGGDSFRYGAASAAWMDAMHKDNALWTFACWYWPVTFAGIQSIMSTSHAASSAVDPGVDLIQDATASGNALRLWVATSGSTRTSFSSTLSLVMGAWNFVAIAVNEPAGSFTFQVNNNLETRVLGGYVSPSVNASSELYLGDSDGATTNLVAGTRMAIAIFWSTALVGGQLLALRHAMLPRFS